MSRRIQMAVMGGNCVLLIAGTAYPILTAMALVMDLVCLLLYEKRDIYALLFFLMPFAVVFKLAPDQFSLFQIYVLAAVLVLALRRQQYAVRMILLICLFVIYNIPDAMVGGYHTLLKMAASLLLLYFFTEDDEGEQLPYYAYAFSGSLLLCSLISKFRFLVPSIDAYAKEETWRQDGIDSIRFAGLYEDPNYYTVGLILSLSLLLLLYARGRIGYGFYVFFIAFSYFGFETGSKSFLFLYALLCICLLVIWYEQKRYRMIGAAFAAFFGVALFTFSGFLYSIERVLGRLFIGDITTGRTEIWGGYLQEFLSDPLGLLFGHGMSAPPLNGGQVPHSTYLDCLYYLGIVGSILLLAAVVPLLIRHLPRGHMNWHNLIPVLLLCALYMFLSELTYGELPFHLMLAWLGMVYGGAEARVFQMEKNTLPAPAFLPVRGEMHD